MSWSVDMRCLYCDGRLPLYRKITHGQFCSTAHRKAYWLEQEQLAVERLHQTHNSLRAFRPPVAPESILGPTQSLAALSGPQSGAVPSAASECDAPVLSGFLPEIPGPRWSYVASMMFAEAPAFETDCRPEGPVLGLPAVLSRHIQAAALVALHPGSSAKDHPLLPRILDLSRREITVSPCWPAVGFHANLIVPAANPVELVWTRSSAAAGASPRIVTLQPLPSRMPRPTLHWPWAPLPAQPAPERLVEDEVPFATRLFPLRRTAAIDNAATANGRPIWVTAPTGIRSPLLVIPPTLVIQPGLGLAVDRVPFSSRLFSLPRVAACTRELLNSSRLEATAHLDAPLAPRFQPDLALAKVRVPFSSRVLSLPRFGARESLTSSQQGPPTPLDVNPPAVLLRRDIASGIHPSSADRTLSGAGLLTLAMPEIPLVHSTLVVERRVESLGGVQRATPSSASSPAMSTTQPYPQLKMAEGQRYAVEFRGSRMRPPLGETSGSITLPADISLPQRAVLQAAGTLDDFVPESAGLVPLGFHAEVPVFEPAAPAASRLSGIPQPLQPEPLRPSSRLEPIDGKPLDDAIQPEAPGVGLGFSGMGMPLPKEAPAARMPLWALATGFWKHAPRDLKLLMFAIPALLALAFHPALPKVAVAASPATGELKRSIATAVNGQLASVRQVVYDRAAVALDEDFRSGLDDWASRGDATTKWSFDATGFVRPGPLALYRPSMGLTDYEMQFLGMIDQKAMSWVVRAADFNNYYVVKLVVLKPGPQTTVGITRYAVIDGKAQDRADTVVPIDARPDMLYRVLLDVREDSFALSIQGQMVDNWSDPRLRHGGIGFFTARGEESRVRWVQVTHQYDMLGRLCAYLAPYEIPNTNGSW